MNDCVAFVVFYAGMVGFTFFGYVAGDVIGERIFEKIGTQHETLAIIVLIMQLIGSFTGCLLWIPVWSWLYYAF